MNLTQVKAATALMWRLKREGKIKDLPIPTLVGDTGIGKSSIMSNIYNEELGSAVKEVIKEAKAQEGDITKEAPKVTVNKVSVKDAAKDMQKYLEFLFLAQMETGDLIGMPDKLGDRTIFYAPDWFPEKEAKGLLVLDELGDSDTNTRKAIMPLLLTGKLHRHVLPKDVMIICAMNPIGGNFGGIGFTKQFRNRLAFWKVTPSVDEWLVYAEKAGLPQYIKAMVAEQPSFLEDQNESNQGWENSSAYDGIPSRRSIATAAQVLASMTDQEIKLFGDELITSMVGPNVSGSMFMYKALKIEEVMKAEELWDDTAGMLTKIDNWLQSQQTAKVAAFLRLIKAYLSNTKSLKDYDVEALGKLLTILPEDMIAGMLFFIKNELSYQFELLVALGAIPEIFSKLENVMSIGKD